MSLLDRIITYPSQQAWDDDRRPGDMGATAVAAMRGEYFYGPWTLWATVHAPHLIAARADDGSMAAGSLWEPRIATVMAHSQGYRLRRPLCRVQHPDVSWLRPSPDGFVDKDGDLGGVEIKALRSRAGWGADGTVIDYFSADAEEIVTPYILTQAYINMEAAGLDYWLLWIGFGFQDVRTFTVLRDEAHQAELVEQTKAWRAKHLVGGEPPEYDDSRECRYYLGREHSREGERKATEGETALVLSYVEHHTREKDAKAAKSAIYQELVPLMNADGTKTLIINQPGRKPGRFTVGTNGSPRATNLETT